MRQAEAVVATLGDFLRTNRGESVMTCEYILGFSAYCSMRKRRRSKSSLHR